MANGDPLPALIGASCVLPDGRRLFPPLDLHLDARPTGLVGDNGVGKSVLCRLLAGDLAPTIGRRVGGGVVHYLPQQVAVRAGQTVAGLAGLEEVFAALARIAAGSIDAADFDRVGERWGIGAQLQAELALAGLQGLAPDRPASTLSGGEAMRVALAGAWLSGADLLILDEPSNHLDGPQRARLMARLQAWPGALLLVSHDRALLAGMQRIVELTPAGVEIHPGGYSVYAAAREQERLRSRQRLEQRRLEMRRLQATLRTQHDRQQRRQARGNVAARQANQAPILLGLAKDRSEGSAGRLAARHALAKVRAEEAVRTAASQVVESPQLAMFAPVGAEADRVVARLRQATQPWGPETGADLDLVLTGRMRVGVTGPSGSGKSSLLAMLAGRLAPLSGHCATSVPTAWLDQRLDVLDPALPVWAQLRAANPQAAEAGLRMRLALLGLDAGRLQVPVAELSGGERVKAALACVLYAAAPPELLLLDEPGNHLDLAALEALEQMLRQYRGALVVVSHDGMLLERIGPTHRLDTAQAPWRLALW